MANSNVLEIAERIGVEKITQHIPHVLGEQLEGKQDQFQLLVKGAPQSALRIVHFKGEEAVNALYRFELELYAQHEADPLATLEDTLLGQPATLAMNEHAAMSRAVHGLVVSYGIIDNAHRTHRVRLEIGPRLGLLTLRTNYRIYQDKTVPEIVTELLKEWNIVHSFELVGTYTPRTYCTQYAETDFEFLKRILAREGIFFFFRHPTETESEEVVFMDEPLYKSVPQTHMNGIPSGKLSMRTGRFAERDMLEVGLKRGLRPFASRVSTYDFRNPRLPLRDVKLAATPPGALGDYGSERFATYLYGHEAEHEASQSAKRREVDASRTLEGQRTDDLVINGSCRFRQFNPGQSITLEGHQVDALNRDWVLTSVVHEGWTPELEPEATEVYHNRFEAVAAEVPLRMPVPDRNRFLQPTQTATVVGASDGELFTDTLGRIKVQFHWDLMGTNDENSSCWIRVSQPWAGPGFGWQFLPRVGTEVVIAFLDGDPDRPLVVGSVYNGTNPTPFGLPNSASKSGIRTQSVPGGAGANELSFEDKAGNEEIAIKAHRNLSTEVGKDHLTNVTGDSNLSVAGQLTQHVGGTLTTTVVGGQTSLVTLARTSQVLGDAIDAVKGNANRRISGDETVRIEGTLRNDFNATDTTVAADSVTRVKGHLTAVVGQENAHKSASIQVQGDTSLYSTGHTEFISDSDVVIRVGASSIRITPIRIEIQSPAVTLNGLGVEIGADALSIDAKQKMNIKGKHLNLSGESSSLDLTKEAELGGDHVHIKKNVQDAHVLVDPRFLTTIILNDEDGKPAANRRYVIVNSKGEERSGILDDQGQAKLELEASAQIYFPKWTRPGKAEETKMANKPYIIRQGDYFTKLGHQMGFNPETVWAQQSDDLKKKRASMDMLQPGDVVMIPGDPPQMLAIAAGAVNTYVARIPKVPVNITVQVGGKILPKEPYKILGVGPDPIEGATDENGVLSTSVQVHVREIEVHLTDRKRVLRVRVGDMDPINELSGVQKRLTHLGFYQPTKTGTENFDALDAEQIISGLRAFQASKNLKVTGKMDDDTEKALIAAADLELPVLILKTMAALRS